MDAGNQVRVILWSIPRSGSTAFEKCMTNLDDVQIINEPYVSVYTYGPEKKECTEEMQRNSDAVFEISNTVKVEYDAGWESETATYRFVKDDLMEAEYPGKKVVFVKDMSYGITGNLDMLPKGYRHAFLIRNPVKLFASWKKVLNTFPTFGGVELKLTSRAFTPDKHGFGESFQLYNYLVKTGIEENPVIIDSDDLLENPKSILRQFCERTGIQYTDRLLSWDAGDGVVKTWKASSVFIKANKVFGFYNNAFESKSFYKPSPEPNRSELADDVNECIDTTIPYYEKLYALRIKPEDGRIDK